METANRAAQFINAIHEAVAQRNEAEQGRGVKYHNSLHGTERFAEQDGRR